MSKLSTLLSGSTASHADEKTRRLVQVGECVPFSQKLDFIDQYDESTSVVSYMANGNVVADVDSKHLVTSVYTEPGCPEFRYDHPDLSAPYTGNGTDLTLSNPLDDVLNCFDVTKGTSCEPDVYALTFKVKERLQTRETYFPCYRVGKGHRAIDVTSGEQVSLYYLPTCKNSEAMNVTVQANVEHWARLSMLSAEVIEDLGMMKVTLLLSVPDPYYGILRPSPGVVVWNTKRSVNKVDEETLSTSVLLHKTDENCQVLGEKTALYEVQCRDDRPDCKPLLNNMFEAKYRIRTLPCRTTRKHLDSSVEVEIVGPASGFADTFHFGEYNGVKVYVRNENLCAHYFDMNKISRCTTNVNNFQCVGEEDVLFEDGVTKVAPDGKPFIVNVTESYDSTLGSSVIQFSVYREYDYSLKQVVETITAMVENIAYGPCGAKRRSLRGEKVPRNLLTYESQSRSGTLITNVAEVRAARFMPINESLGEPPVRPVTTAAPLAGTVPPEGHAPWLITAAVVSCILLCLVVTFASVYVLKTCLRKRKKGNKALPGGVTPPHVPIPPLDIQLSEVKLTVDVKQSE